MKWNQNQSIRLSQAFILLFSGILLIVDLCAFWLVNWFIQFSMALSGSLHYRLLLGTLYGGSIFAWFLLYSLWKLLQNMKQSIVFDVANIQLLRWTGWACFGGALLCLFSSFYYFPFIIITIAAAFVGLIVRIVKNVFVVAESMKNELDYTV